MKEQVPSRSSSGGTEMRTYRPKPRGVCPRCSKPTWGKNPSCVACRSISTIEARFLSKVNKRGPSILATPCWTWTGTKTHEGYGQLWFKRKAERATRIALMLYSEPLPEGKVACHRCDNPTCVNPEHLFAGTLKANSQDCIRKGRFSRKLTPSDVLVIRSRKNEPVETIAKLYRVHPQTIGALLRGKTWKAIQ